MLKSQDQECAGHYTRRPFSFSLLPKQRGVREVEVLPSGVEVQEVRVVPLSV